MHGGVGASMKEIIKAEVKKMLGEDLSIPTNITDEELEMFIIDACRSHHSTFMPSPVSYKLVAMSIVRRIIREHMHQAMTQSDTAERLIKDFMDEEMRGIYGSHKSM